MAQTAYEGENYEEAYNYYNQVLEIDNTDADSWFGKGYTAVWQSTLADDKTKEMIPDQILTGSSCVKGQVLIIKKTKKNTKPKFLFELIFILFITL